MPTCEAILRADALPVTVVYKLSEMNWEDCALFCKVFFLLKSFSSLAKLDSLGLPFFHELSCEAESFYSIGFGNHFD